MVVPPDLEAWMREHMAPTPDLEPDMRRAGESRGFPIVGPLVGRFLEVAARSIGARRVFEMGSGFGYSTLWFAHAVGPQGEVVHTDGDPNNSAEAQDWLTKAGIAERVRFETGDAMALLAREPGDFDVIFIDVDKEGYPQAWDVARQHVRVGGLILTDNTLWSGKVADAGVDDDATRGVRAYVERAMGDPDFVTTINPVRDGVAMSYRLR